MPNRSDILRAISRSEPEGKPIKTGTWRKIAPFFDEKKSPCAYFCPCAENIPVWMDLAGRGNFGKAWEVLTEENPFPMICGRACYRFCEKECNRKESEEGISINSIERFLGDFGIKNNFRAFINENGGIGGLKVAIIGGGPAGLSAAHFLAKEKADVAIFDKNSSLGGMLAIGIPQYRLPKKLLEAEIRNMVLSLGVEIKLGFNVGVREFSGIKERFDFVVVALGAHKSKKINDRINDSARIMPGLEFLRIVNSGAIKKLSFMKRVCVVGGGNTAIDVSRVLLRLGVEDVSIVYRRTENEMPAHHDEIEAAKKEGVCFSFLTQPVSASYDIREKMSIRCRKMELSESDESGRRKPVEIPGSEFEISCDFLFYAVGEETDKSFLSGINHKFETENDFADGRVICAGDALYGPRSVSEAISSGKKAAFAIIEKAGRGKKEKDGRKIVEAKDIKFHYINRRRKNPAISSEKKLTPEEFFAFEETTETITAEAAVEEAIRCINCGICTNCQRCFNFCPDFSILEEKAGNKLMIDLEYCKGCGICAEVCERGVISSRKEGGDEHS